MTDPCPELHIPHKEWSGREELENYAAIERWAKTRGCGGGACDCFLQTRTAAGFLVPFADDGNLYTIIDPWDDIIDCGIRPASSTATTVLIVEWEWNDFGDGDIFGNVFWGEGIGVVSSNDEWVAKDTRLATNWQSGVLAPTGKPQVGGNSGSLTVVLNVSGNPAPGPADIAVWQTSGSGGVGNEAHIDITTYEYSLCGCECQQ